MVATACAIVFFSAPSVTVMQTGFDYQGRSFASLSAVARHITGSQWNGPAFFGLRERRL